MKRKFLSIALSALIAGGAVYYPCSVSDFSMTASAEDYTTVYGEELTYDVYSDHVEISGLSINSTVTDVEIPSEIDGLPVTKITDMAFYAESSVTSITIPDSITEIGHGAFSGCSGLTEITIPDSVTLINHSAFSGCIALISVTLPSSITSIENNTFKDCTSLVTMTIPESVASIGEYAFYRSSLTEIVIPNAVTSIGAHSFAECESLVSAEISGSVATIDGWAFDGCTALTTLTLMEGIQEIGMAAFQNTALTSVVVPESVQTVAMDCFSGNNLMSATILNPEMYFGSNSFRLNEGGVINGYADSTAQEYAERYDYTFEAIISSIYSLGDLDASGTVDPVDATLALQHYSLASMGGGLLTEEQAKYADVNADDAIDPVDATYILRYYSYASMNGEGTFEEFIENN